MILARKNNSYKLKSTEIKTEFFLGHNQKLQKINLFLIY